MLLFVIYDDFIILRTCFPEHRDVNQEPGCNIVLFKIDLWLSLSLAETWTLTGNTAKNHFCSQVFTRDTPGKL